MRRKGTNEQLAERRARGLALLAEGKTPKEVADILQVTRRSVERWQADAKKTKKKRTSKTSRESPLPWCFPLPDLLIRLLSLVYNYENTGC